MSATILFSALCPFYGQTNLEVALKDSISKIKSNGEALIWEPPEPKGISSQLDFAVLRCLNEFVWHNSSKVLVDTVDVIETRASVQLECPEDIIILESLKWRTLNENEEFNLGTRLSIVLHDKSELDDGDEDHSRIKLVCEFKSQSLAKRPLLQNLTPIADGGYRKSMLLSSFEDAEPFHWRDDISWNAPHTLDNLIQKLVGCNVYLKHLFRGEHMVWVVAGR